MTPPHLCAASPPAILPPPTAPALFGRQAQTAPLPNCLSLPPYAPPVPEGGQSSLSALLRSLFDPRPPDSHPGHLLFFALRFFESCALRRLLVCYHSPFFPLLNEGEVKGLRPTQPRRENRWPLKQTAWEFITAEEKADRRKLLLKTIKNLKGPRQTQPLGSSLQASPVLPDFLKRCQQGGALSFPEKLPKHKHPYQDLAGTSHLSFK